MPKPYTWTVELTVDASWVADGFDLSDERAKEMLNRELPFAYGHEIAAKVISAPDAERIAKEQGYKNRADRLTRDPAYARDVADGLYR